MANSWWPTAGNGDEKASATGGAAQGPASCPFCGAGNSKRSLVCWSCGKELVPSSDSKATVNVEEDDAIAYHHDDEVSVTKKSEKERKTMKIWKMVMNADFGKYRNGLIIGGSIVAAALLITSFLPRYQYAESVITKSDDNRGDHIVVRQTIFDMVTGKRYQRELQLEGSRFYRVTNISVHDDPKRPLLNIWEKQGKAMRKLQASPEIWYGWESEDEWDARSSGGGHTLRQYE